MPIVKKEPKDSRVKKEIIELFRGVYKPDCSCEFCVRISEVIKHQNKS